MQVLISNQRNRNYLIMYFSNIDLARLFVSDHLTNIEAFSDDTLNRRVEWDIDEIHTDSSGFEYLNFGDSDNLPMAPIALSKIIEDIRGTDNPYNELNEPNSTTGA